MGARPQVFDRYAAFDFLPCGASQLVVTLAPWVSEGVGAGVPKETKEELDGAFGSVNSGPQHIGANVVSHGRYVAFQMAEVPIPDKCSWRFFAIDCGTTGRSHHQRPREHADHPTFKSTGQEECIQMPARSGPHPCKARIDSRK
jgi:hypothetical protein